MTEARIAKKDTENVVISFIDGKHTMHEVSEVNSDSTSLLFLFMALIETQFV